MSIERAFREATGRGWLYNITPASNIPSILRHGIVSHERAANLLHQDISMPDVQMRRTKEIREGMGRNLHQYANLYIDARNPMMYYLTHNEQAVDTELCVVLVSYSVLREPGTLVTDTNAASSYARFFTPEEAVQQVNFQYVMARSWTDENYYEYCIK